MSRTCIPINRGWKFSPDFKKEYLAPAYADDAFQSVMLPHMNQEIPYNYFDEAMYQYVSCYRKQFTLQAVTATQQVFIDFEGVMTYAAVYLNGTYIGEHKGGYTPFSFNITQHLNGDAENVLAVMVDSTERADIPPFGHVIDYLTYGGIYREVCLRIVDSVYIENAFSISRGVLTDVPMLSTTVKIANPLLLSRRLQVTVALNDGDTSIAVQSKDIHASKQSETVEIDLAALPEIALWSLESPKLYDVIVSLTGDDIDDYFETRFGFRQAEFKSDGFFLNGRRLTLRGLNRHQAYPYVGYAMPKRVQARDADILKQSLHLNIVRTSHYPQSRHFLDRCDEIGLLVLEEIPGWQHIGDAAWKAIACENVREMIVRDRNHASIVLWGVRINESEDCHDFYSQTNSIAHGLDPSRQTCGVRYVTDSELLEDVYTMNDFIQGQKHDPRVLRPQQEVTGLEALVPYLITEYNGHMYPTKRFDQEERLNQHALRHANVINAAAADPFKAGAIGWCAFDYNTHYDFGSGDRICYHGVMDMFRIPKFAAFAYASQVKPEEELILEPVTFCSRGERSIGGIAPLTIFTNCDYIQIYEDKKLLGSFFPCREEYASMCYPPIIIQEMVGLWGMKWHDMTFVGMLNHEPVIRKAFAKNPIYTQLYAVSDDRLLSAGDMDATRIVLKALDQKGNTLPFIDEHINLTLSGPARIVGPDSFALIGGCRAVWIQTTGEPGQITLTAHSNRVEAAVVQLVVE